MNLCLTPVKFYLFLFFLDILVSRCLTGGVTHELVFDIGEVLPMFVLCRYICIKMSYRRCDKLTCV